ncbi:MAG: Na/Pi cotransporter family protein [Rhodobacteraceae bacterium]|nr:Na/Pi cotransporter family protein [Paracoccaceae bacterium]
MIVLATHLAAAVALLLWSVRHVRTGVERAFLPELKQVMRRLSGSRTSAAAGGLLSAMILQSATAVTLLGSGFVASGVLAPTAALALILGADLGSALMAQVLYQPIDWIIPFALLAGIVAFFRGRNRKVKQLGRILIGFALILTSLEMIGQATAAIADNQIVQSIAAYFESDLMSAFVLATLLAWIMHSSLAAVLTFATFAATGLVSAQVAAAMVIGANLGAAIVPFVLLLGADRDVRIVATGNLLARGTVALGFLAALMLDVFTPLFNVVSPAQQAILLHVGLNTMLLLLCLPVAMSLISLASALLPRQDTTENTPVTALDDRALDHAPQALACAQRELLRMAETVQAILVPSMGLFRAWDPEVAETIGRREDSVDRMHFETKIYISKLRQRELSPEHEKKTVDFVAMANSLEDAADRVAVDIAALARKMHDEALAFSDEGRSDLEGFHDQVVTNGQLALLVLTTGDAEAARQLVREKDRIRREEQRLQKRHLQRLQNGKTASVETTNIHQEMLRLMKQVNASMSYVAYPIAEETGDLLKSRLAPAAKKGVTT